MSRTIQLACTLSLAVALGTSFPVLGQDTTQPEAAPEQATTAQKIAAVENLNHTLSVNRTRAEARTRMLRGFLKEKNLLDDYQQSDTADTQPPASMSYDQAVDTAVTHYVQTTPQTLDDELAINNPAQQQRDLLGLETLGRTVYEGYNQARQQNQDMAEFLHERNLFDEYQKWAPVEAAKQQAAAQVEMQKRAAADEAEAKAEHEKAMDLYQQQLARERAQRALKLQREFELKQQRMQDLTEIRTSKFQRGYPYWNTWGDRYPDVYY